jgi:PleD family two-component response regulator
MDGDKGADLEHPFEPSRSRPDGGVNDTSQHRSGNRWFSEIVIVDARCDLYGELVQAATEDAFGLHFCSDAQSALKLSRRFRSDAWLVSLDLPDMGGFDFLPLLLENVRQSCVDPIRHGSRISLDQFGNARHSGVFVVAEEYCIDEEQRSLAMGVSGYLVRPIRLDLMLAMRSLEAPPPDAATPDSPIDPEPEHHTHRAE